jgi:hypothetical protein
MDALYNEIMKQWNKWHRINPEVVERKPTSRQTFFKKMRSGVINIEVPGATTI